MNDLKQRGVRLPTIEEFASCLVSINNPEDDFLINQFGMETHTNIDLLLAVRISDQHFRFMPGPEFSPRLYRGENVFHKHCVPSIFRNGISPIDRCFAIGKIIELSALMDHHPVTHDLRESRIGDLLFGLNIEAIAQHYGFRTQLMDFSRSKDVAMFFATCQYDPVTESYVPLSKGVAVLYTADMKNMIEHRKVLPLGLEPLPRPEAQRALAVRLNSGENLNDMSWVTREELEITTELSRRYFDMFDGGAKLFPLNPFDKHVQSIRQSKLLPLEALEFGVDKGLIPYPPGGINGAKNALLSAGYLVQQCSMEVEPETIKAAADEWEQSKAAYYNRIRVRGVTDHVSLS